jgi:hypothetical protein
MKLYMGLSTKSSNEKRKQSKEDVSFALLIEHKSVSEKRVIPIPT